jgi:hypothetical protein
MFVGHFGAAFGSKPAAPRLSLGTLVFAFQWADLLWPLLLLIGVEHVRGVAGLMPTNPYDFYDYPVSHSLAALVLWGGLFAGIHYARRRDRAAAATIFAGVVSHWLLDFLMHRPDMPVLPGGPYLGLGLWRSVPATLAIEGALYAAGIGVYLFATRARDRIGTWAFWALVVLLGAGWGSSLGTTKPMDERQLAWGALSMWLVVPWAAWIDRHRAGRGK